LWGAVVDTLDTDYQSWFRSDMYYRARRPGRRFMQVFARDRRRIRDLTTMSRGLLTPFQKFVPCSSAVFMILVAVEYSTGAHGIVRPAEWDVSSHFMVAFTFLSTYPSDHIPQTLLSYHSRSVRSLYGCPSCHFNPGRMKSMQKGMERIA